MAINALFYENSIPTGTGVLEILKDAKKEGKVYSDLFVPLQRSELKGTFHGPIGSLILSQTFLFSREFNSTPIEALYRFPLPGDAAVSEVLVTFGDEVIRTKLIERTLAEENYDRAFSEGKKAALVTRESADVFTLHLTGICPDMEVTVKTTFTVLARAVMQEWEVRIPLTIAPRYIRSDEKHPAIQANPLLSAIDPGYKFSLDLLLKPAVQVTSVKPDTEVIYEPDGTRIKFQDKIPDRDFVLHWTTSGEKKMLTAWSVDDTESGHRYIISLVNPPEKIYLNTIPREIILVVDQSGSMKGSKWEAAKRSLFAFLDTLCDNDFFNICIFSDKTAWASKNHFMKTSLENIESAKSFVNNISLFGGTELGVALEQAINQRQIQGEFSRHIVVITDGQVTDESRILLLAESMKMNYNSRRISVITIDSSPNAFLTTELARLGGGVAKFLTDKAEVGKVLKEILLSWQQPLFYDAILKTDSHFFDVPGFRQSKKGISSIDIGDIRPGTPVFLYGRTSLTGDAVNLSLMSAKSGTIGVTTAIPGDNALSSSIKILFGAAKIQALEFIQKSFADPDKIRERLKTVGYDLKIDENTAAVYPENKKNFFADELRHLLIEESIRFGVPSTLTAFIGVSEKNGIVPDITIAVPNTLPEGWDEDVFTTASIKIIGCGGAGNNTINKLFHMKPKKLVPDGRLIMKSKSSRNIDSVAHPCPPYSEYKSYHKIIDLIQTNDDRTVLFDGYQVSSGNLKIRIEIISAVSSEKGEIIIFLDNIEIGTWRLSDLQKGMYEYILKMKINTPGILKGVLFNLDECWDGKFIEVDIMVEA